MATKAKHIERSHRSHGKNADLMAFYSVKAAPKHAHKEQWKQIAGSLLAGALSRIFRRKSGE